MSNCKPEITWLYDLKTGEFTNKAEMIAKNPNWCAGYGEAYNVDLYPGQHTIHPPPGRSRLKDIELPWHLRAKGALKSLRVEVVYPLEG